MYFKNECNQQYNFVITYIKCIVSEITTYNSILNIKNHQK